jgi:quercetin dioxygenase-like cupin family protein
MLDYYSFTIGAIRTEVSVLRWDAGEGLRREARGSEMWFKATASQTQGRFSLMERTLPPGGRMPPAHSHIGNDEAYFVLDGDVEFRVADDVFIGSTGTFVLVPAGETHTFGNTRDEPARLLVLHAPALDGYFKDLEQLWAAPDPPHRDEELALMKRHGMNPA